MRASLSPVLALIITVCAPPVRATEIHVPSERPHISAALTIAMPGDEIVLADGTYSDVNDVGVVVSVPVTIRSASGDPNACVLNFANGGPMTLNAPGAVLAGVGVRNAGSIAIRVQDSVLIQSARFVDNMIGVDARFPAGSDGLLSIGNSTFVRNVGAVTTLRGSAVVEDCVFNYNGANRDTAGGVHVRGASLTVSRCVFTNNLNQGAISVFDPNRATVTRVVDCVMVGNDAAIRAYGPTLFVSDCIFEQTRYWVILASLRASATFERCRFSNNDEQSLRIIVADATVRDCGFFGNAGYAIGAFGAETQIARCIVVGHSNVAISLGGASHQIDACLVAGNGSRAINCNSGSVRLNNCTLANNSETLSAIQASNAAAVSVSNSIIWDHVPATAIDMDSTIDINHSLVRGGWPGVGNIDAAPMFADPNDGDYRLAPGSPAIDAGSNWLLPTDALDLDGDLDTAEPLSTDLGGFARRADDPDTVDSGAGAAPIVDIGAFEFGAGPPDIACDSDLTGDRQIDLADLAELLAAFGVNSNGDITGDGVTDLADLSALLAQFGRDCDAG